MKYFNIMLKKKYRNKSMTLFLRSSEYSQKLDALVKVFW